MKCPIEYSIVTTETVYERKNMAENILVVDDDEEFANLIVLLLTKKGYTAEAAYGGKQALAMAVEKSPSIVVQDYMLPDYKGIELLKDIKERCPGTYVIIVTAKGNEEVAVDLLKGGASDYIKKPFEVEKLLKTIENVLRLRSTVAERDRLHHELAQQNQEMMALNALSVVLTSSMPQLEKCKSAVGIVLKNMDVDLVNIFEVVDGGMLRVIASEGRDMSGLEECVIKGNVGLSSYVAEIKKPAVVMDFHTEKRFKVPDEVFERGITSAMSVPLIAKGVMRGAITVYCKEKRVFPAFEMKLVTSFANLVALAMENAELMATIEQLKKDKS